MTHIQDIMINKSRPKNDINGETVWQWGLKGYYKYGQNAKKVEEEMWNTINGRH